MKYFPLIWSGLRRKRGCATLILLQLAVAFLLFGLLRGMRAGVDDALHSVSADLFVVMRASSLDPLPLALYSRLQSVPGVKSVGYETELVGTYQDPSQQVLALATDAASAVSTIPGVNLDAATLARLQATRTGAAVSAGMAARFGWKSGDRVVLKALPAMQKKDGSDAWTFDVVGTFEPGERSLKSDFLVINYAYLDEARLNNPGTVSLYLVRVNEARNSAPVIHAIDAAFANSADETRTQSLREAALANIQSIGDLDFVIRAVVGATLFASLLSVGAMMMQSARERTPELAVLKAVGFSGAHLCALLVSESLVICLAAAFIGLGAAYKLLPGAKSFTQLALSMPDSVLVMGAGLAALIAIATAAVPAWRAARLPVAEALRRN